jgi:hypothetical protein
MPAYDPALFAELMLSWEIRSYRWALRQRGTVFFDHAIPGLPGYHRLVGLDVPIPGTGTGYVELPRAEPAERLRFVIRDLSPPA